MCKITFTQNNENKIIYPQYAYLTRLLNIEICNKINPIRAITERIIPNTMKTGSPETLIPNITRINPSAHNIRVPCLNEHPQQQNGTPSDSIHNQNLWKLDK